jgi:hypothetical protein
MLRSIDGVRNRSKRRPQGPPRTIQEAAEAFIAHVEEMEAGLERALDKKKFDVRYVGDLDKLVPVVERAFDHANRAMDARVTFMRLLSDLLHRSRAEIQKKEGVTLVTLGALKQETDEALHLLRLSIMRYQTMLIHFVMEILGSGLRYEFESDSENEFYFGSARPPHDPRELPKKINEKLYAAAGKLGTCLSSSQVAGAYSRDERDSDAKSRDLATRLAQFVCDCYYNRLRGKVVSYLEKEERFATANLALNVANGDVDREDQEAQIGKIKEDTKEKLRSIDYQFRIVKSNLRAIEIKNTIQDLASRVDESTKRATLTRSEGSLASLKSRIERVTNAHHKLLGIAKDEVRLFFVDLTSQLDHAPDGMRVNMTSNVLYLKAAFQAYMTDVSERMFKEATKLISELKKAEEEKEEETRREEERERRSAIETESPEEDESEDRVIRESKKKLDALLHSLDELDARKSTRGKRAWHDAFGRTSYAHGSSNVFGSAFGRYVHRVARNAQRVPHRAWSA